MAYLEASEWTEFLSANPGAHLLQTAQWGELKSRFGWEIKRIRVGAAGVQILFRKTPIGLTIGYIPKGPVGKDWKDLWPEVFAISRRMKAVVLRVEPDAWENESMDVDANFPGFSTGAKCVQPRRTILVDLSGSEKEWLARMKQKTRYNINLSERKGVTVETSADIEKFERMMKVTGARDGFGVHNLAYYRTVYDLFSRSDRCALLEAKYEDKTLAMVMVFAHDGHGYYLYGASCDEERNRMPTYKIQWEAMRWCGARGCRDYDLYGVPDYDEDALEAGFEARSDGMWGVYRFKRGFGGRVMRAAAPREKVFLPAIYRLFRLIEDHV
jgi:lipid II:glycine glycyltransferase (peptidoglycan interpeptide bridge formation enzyme)